MSRIAFIGLGTMGAPMAAHLVGAGHEVTGHNRSAEKAKAWSLKTGARCADRVEDAIAEAEFVVSCLGNDQDVAGLAGMLASAAQSRGALWIYHTTISASGARNCAQIAGQAGIGFLDAPVSGGQSGAENGTLTVMAGGNPADFARAGPVLAAYARNAVLMGPVGAGQLAKMANQIAIAGIVQGLSEALNFALAAGLDPEKLIAAISQGAAQSWQMNNRWKSMVEGRFGFGFAVDWMRKDLGLVRDEARRIGAPIPVTEQIDQFYAEIQATGGGRQDSSSLITRLRPRSTAAIIRAPDSTGHPPALALPGFADIEAAAARLAPFAIRTPLLRADGLDKICGAEIHVKPENLQRGGAFKFRGAMNRLAALGTAERKAGVVAFSSGNHALAVAKAAQILGIEASIVMPADAPALKREGVIAAGAHLRLYDRLSESREAIAADIARGKGAVLVPPFDDPMIIAGQGTSGLEIALDLADRGMWADDLVCPTSGGGLLSGIALAFARLSPQTRLWAAEPEGHDDYRRSLAAGMRVENPAGIRTICDGLMVPAPGDRPWAILRDRLAGAIPVSDAAVKQAMALAFSRLKLVLEPSGAAALAAVLTERERFAGRRVVVVLSGGNVDHADYARWLAEGMLTLPVR